MKTKTKKHETPEFEVIVNKESNKKFFVASSDPYFPAENSVNARSHVSSWSNGWE